MRRSFSLGMTRVVTLAISAVALAIGSVTRAEPPFPPETPGDHVIAQVGTVPITRAVIDRQNTTFSDHPIAAESGDPAGSPERHAAALSVAIAQELVLVRLAELGDVASTADVNLELDRLGKRLARVGVTLEQHLDQTDQTGASLRREILWRLSWSRYLERVLTDEAMRTVFNRDPRPWNGTQLECAHHVWRQTDTRTADECLQLAASAREDLTSGRTTWDRIASDALGSAPRGDRSTGGSGGSVASPSAKNTAVPSAAGYCGWIARFDPMPDAFAAAAYRTPVGEVSSPVALGGHVHLIWVMAERPGQRTFEEARGELLPSLRATLFRRLAEAGAKKVPITVAPNWAWSPVWQSP